MDPPVRWMLVRNWGKCNGILDFEDYAERTYNKGVPHFSPPLREVGLIAASPSPNYNPCNPGGGWSV